MLKEKIYLEENKHVKINAIIGIVSFWVLMFIVFMYQVFRALPFGDLSAVLFAFGAAGMFSRYHSTKDRRCLGFGIFNALACLLSLGWYLWLTL